MDIKNCKECKRLFNYFGGEELCPECSKKMDLKFLDVKAYIYDNPSASLYQVSEDMEVTVRQLKSWIREERLAFTEESDVSFRCDSCGAQIRTGRYCRSCKTNLINNLKGMYAPKDEGLAYPQKGNAKMRYMGQQKGK